MGYKLIADAGSTKTEWVAVDEDGNELTRFSTRGINAMLTPVAERNVRLQEASAMLPTESSPTQIFFYGAGCAMQRICNEMELAIGNILNPQRGSFVASDLLGAARSLLGRSSGIACILGTGSNSCLYDGNAITANIPSLGFILGDEGSGASLGKRLVSDAFKGHLPKIVTQRLLEEYKLTKEDILEKVYRQPGANSFLASLAPFIKSHLWNPYVYSLVRQEFESFLTRNISPYPGSRTLPISFTGSIAFYFEKVLRQSAARLGYKVGTVTRHPIDGLVRFHSHLS